MDNNIPSKVRPKGSVSAMLSRHSIHQNKGMSGVVITTLLLILVLPSTVSANCPVNNTQDCSCTNYGPSNSFVNITCSNLGILKVLPIFTTPQSVIIQLLAVVPGSPYPSVVLMIQSKALAVLKPVIVQLANISINTVQADAFVGLETTVTQIYLDNNNIMSLPNNTFSRLQNMNIIGLSYNRLTSLPDNLFANMQTLTTLNLQGNQLSSLPATIFNGLSQLTYLDLSFNNLTDLLQNLLLATTQLTSLNLCGNKLFSMSSSTVFPTLNSLTWFNMSMNSLAGLPTNLLLTFPNLITLDLSHNNIPNVSEATMKNFTSLLIICLNNNLISLLYSDTFRSQGQLVSLYLDHNVLTSIGSGLFSRNPSLAILTLSNNKIQSIDPVAFASPCAIKTFDISHNLLTSFDPSLFPNLALVGRLTLSNNLLTSIASDGTNTQITNLDLSYNRLTTLTNAFMKTLPSLQSVTVSNNAITSIDTGLFTLNSLLKTADLSYNLLTTINSIGGPIQTTLNLANNRITSINGAAFGATVMTTLNLESNRVTPTIANLQSMPGLLSLDLSNNSIQSLQSAMFRSSPSLSMLDLSANNLTTISSDHFTGLSHLQSVDISRNGLRTVENNTIPFFSSNVKLWMNGNPLDCSCLNLWARVPIYIQLPYQTLCSINRTAWTWTYLVCNPATNCLANQSLTVPPPYPDTSALCTSLLKPVFLPYPPSTTAVPSTIRQTGSSITTTTPLIPTDPATTSDVNLYGQLTAIASKSRAIIGGAVGGVINLVVLVVVIVLLVKRSNDKNKARNQLLSSNAQLNGGGDSLNYKTSGETMKGGFSEPDFGPSSAYKFKNSKFGIDNDDMRWKDIKNRDGLNPDVKDDDDSEDGTIKRAKREQRYTEPEFGPSSKNPLGVFGKFGLENKENMRWKTLNPNAENPNIREDVDGEYDGSTEGRGAFDHLSKRGGGGAGDDPLYNNYQMPGYGKRNNAMLWKSVTGGCSPAESVAVRPVKVTKSMEEEEEDATAI